MSANLGKKLFLGFLFLTLASCKVVKIQDGRVPADYLTEAKKLEGTYHGKFEGVEGDLTIQFVGDKPQIIYSSPEGSSIAGRDCPSQIGDLTEVTVSSKNGKNYVDDAVFNFYPHCNWIEGKKLDLNFKYKNNGVYIEASILKETRPYEDCQWVGGGGPGYPPPQQHCTMQYQYIYILGNFKKN